MVGIPLKSRFIVKKGKVPEERKPVVSITMKRCSPVVFINNNVLIIVFINSNVLINK